jgi:DNA modification methylase
MKIEKVKIAELNPAEYNPRRMTSKQYEDLKNSLEKFGLVDPIIINSDNTVVGGHQRLRIMRELGAELVPVVRVNLSKEDEKELNIRLNKNTGEFDIDVLANNFEVDELKDWGFKDIELGFNIDKIVEGNIKDDHIPEVKETRVKLGDVWQLGKHRLMCGDSTKESDVEKLMNGEKVDMVFTDPPYNIDYKGIKDNRKIKNDKMSNEKFIEFLYNSLNISTDTFYVCCSWQYCHLFKQALEELKKPVKSFIVWNKVNPAQHLDKYFKQHEIILYHGKFGGQKTLRGDIWEVKRERNTVHPTMKPISLIQIALEDNNKKKLIYDPFLGSGSTLIACEKTNRICYGMELDTKYCDVIIERWEQFTGQKAKKCGV